MTLRLKVLTLVLVLLPAGHSARAQGFALGTFHSFKGLGLSAEIPSSKPKEYNSFSLFADLARVYTGDSPSPGVKFNMSHNIRIVDFKPRTADRISLFSGAGFSAGWVRDSGKDCYGLTGALSGTIGARAAFSCNIVLSLGITLETGILLYKDNGHIKSTLYRDGIYQTVLPHLGIYYLFE